MSDCEELEGGYLEWCLTQWRIKWEKEKS